MNPDLVSPKMVGDKVMLGPVRDDLNNLYRRWLHDMEMSMYLVPSRLLTFQMESDWLRAAAAGGHILFTVYEKQSAAPIGITSLMAVDHVNRHAEFGIMIGEKEFQNRGYGTEATVLTIDFGFNILNLESIYLRVHEFNSRAIRTYEKVGFQICGRRRKSYYVGGKYYDDVYMDIIKSEFSRSLMIPLMEKITERKE
jgi:RimJ/RimL family protein N-acetyltransferase